MRLNGQARPAPPAGAGGGGNGGNTAGAGDGGTGGPAISTMVRGWHGTGRAVQRRTVPSGRRIGPVLLLAGVAEDALRCLPMEAIRIVDVTDEASYGLVPPCADPGFDHRSCDYWEDAARGSKAARASWLEPAAPRSRRAPRPAGQPVRRPGRRAARQPVPAASVERTRRNPFASADDDVARRQPLRPGATVATDRGRRGAAQARSPRARARRLRELRQGPARRRRTGRVRPVRTAVGVPAGAPPPRALPAAPRRPAPGRDHVHRHHAAGRAGWVTPTGLSRPSATTSPSVASRRSRRTPRSGRGPTRRAAPPPGSGSAPGSAWPSTMSASRSCAGSSADQHGGVPCP